MVVPYINGIDVLQNSPEVCLVSDIYYSISPHIQSNNQKTSVCEAVYYTRLLCIDK